MKTWQKKLSLYFDQHPFFDKLLAPLIISIISGIITFFICNYFIPTMDIQKAIITNNISIVTETSQETGISQNTNLSESQTLKMLRNNINLERSQTIHSLAWALIAFTAVLILTLAYIHFKTGMKDKESIVICLGVSWFIFFLFILNLINELGSKIQAWS